MTARPGYRRRRGGAGARSVALVLVLALAACSDGDGGAADTSAVGQELLSSRSGLSGSVPMATEGEGGSTTRAVDVSQLGFEWGEEEAPLRILEFSDFGCGYCRGFHVDTWPTLYREYVESGKVRWKYVPMVLGIFGPNSEDAAVAAECAGAQGLFRPMADALFQEQSAWKRSGDAASEFRRMAEQVGVDAGAWESCVADGARRERVDAGTALSRQLGVRGTPTFFVVGYGAIPGAIPLETFREVLDSAYVHATRAGDTGP